MKHQRFRTLNQFNSILRSIQDEVLPSRVTLLNALSQTIATALIVRHGNPNQETSSGWKSVDLLNHPNFSILKQILFDDLREITYADLRQIRRVIISMDTAAQNSQRAVRLE